VVSLSPTTNLPDLMLAPVFASMIEPSVVSPGGPALPAADGSRQRFQRPRGSPPFA
jgi:hypothetical protein